MPTSEHVHPHRPDESTRLVVGEPPREQQPADADRIGRAHWPGYVLTLLSCLFFAGSAMFNKLATTGHQLSSETVVFFFSLVITTYSFVCIVLTPVARESLSKLKPSHYVAILIRGIIGTINVLLLYKAFSLSPVGPADSAYFVTPAFTLVLAAIFLRERFGLPDAFLAFGSIIGVVMISLPALFTSESLHDSLVGPEGSHELRHMLGVLSALFAAFFNAIGMVLTRSYMQHIHFLYFVFAYGVCGLIVTALMGHATNPWHLYQLYPNAVISAITVGFCASTAQLLLHWSLFFVPAGRTALVRNCEVPLVYLLGVIFLAETPAFIPFLGSVIVVASAVAIGVRQLFR